MDELRANLDVDAVAHGATTPEQAAEIYAASLLAVTVDSAAERGYLAMLAARLKLDDALVDPDWTAAWRRMMARLEEGASLGGRRVEREEFYHC